MAFGGLVFSSALFLSSPKAEEVDANVGNYTTDASTYYSGITAGSGTALMGQLHDLMVNTHKTYTTYTDCKTPAYVYAMEPGSSSDYITDFYTQEDIQKAWGGGATGSWNREHVWCQSHSIDTASSTQMWGTTYGGSDLHHIRPIECTLNSSRNNNRYGELNNLGLSRDSYKTYSKDSNKNVLYHGGYVDKDNDIYEPLDAVKGDVARILMYTYVHYSAAQYIGGSSDGALDVGSTCGKLAFHHIVHTSVDVENADETDVENAAIEMLLRWNTSDPVSAEEIYRNNQAAIYQGNRNPFIDHSEYADSIWSGSVETVDVTGVALNTASASIDIGEIKQLTATVVPSNASNKAVSWTSNNTDVATVDSTGKVTGVATGNATITVTTSDGSFTDTCAITVTQPVVDYIDKEVTFTFAQMGYSNAEVVASASSGLITLVLAKGTHQTSPAYYVSDSTLRLYQGNTFVVSCQGYNITSIVINCSTTSTTEGGPACMGTMTGYSYAENSKVGTWTGSATSVNFSPSVGKVFMTSVVVTYEVPALTRISTAGETTNYTTGDSFSYNGTLTAHYYDSSSKTVTPTSISSPDMSSAGTRVITLTYTENEITAQTSYTITITDPVYAVTGVSLNQTSLELTTGETYALVATVAPNNATNKNVIFESGDDGVVGVDDEGNLSAHSAGVATITVTTEDGGFQASCEVTVTSSVSSTGYKLVESTAELLDGAEVCIASTVSGTTYVMKTYNASERRNNIGYVGGSIAYGVLSPEENYGEFTVVKDNSGYGFKDVNDKYLYCPSDSSNQLRAGSFLENAHWTINIGNEGTSITNITYSERSIRYNSSDGLFASYKGTQKAISIYADVTAGTQAFVNNYLYMDSDTENQCVSYYPTAKTQLLAMGEDYIGEFKNNSSFNLAQARYEAWAAARGDETPYEEAAGARTVSYSSPRKEKTAIVIAAIVGTGLVGTLLLIHRRKKED